ncbi:ACP S-malonyltransferase [Proteiniborus sp. MB09-C3]|uniref:ACP S-malonyltransferase n=1 Tax=Proteiniborus sp. MB09-C3 TaxID=3050072 RepID=UPI00255476FC|nr:ACP S-malonyltransferase [Proteiniborus sp. MB09-C3]WIV10827.1 ACP S-malonyltransferase [Proteiniborus sp. MB09-C3]
MGKVAFLFPGQGAQYIGMGKEITDKYSIANRIFDAASEILSLDMKKLCFQGPDEELTKTEFTQPAILTTSIAVLKVIEKYGLSAEVCAGLSLGEYSALVYSQALSFEEAVGLVRKRGKYMQEAVPLGKGTMAAILGLDDDTIVQIIDKASEKGIIEGANYNCPGQVVLSGEIEAIREACNIAKEKGAKKATILSVSAPFHCSMLAGAGENLKSELEKVTINKPAKSFISNVTGNYVNNAEEIRDLLIRQVSMPVLWEQSIERMINDGVDTLIEIGPGKTLIGFAKKIGKKNGRELNLYNVENIETLEHLTFKIKH